MFIVFVGSIKSHHSGLCSSLWHRCDKTAFGSNNKWIDSTVNYRLDYYILTIYHSSPFFRPSQKSYWQEREKKHLKRQKHPIVWSAASGDPSQITDYKSKPCMHKTNRLYALHTYWPTLMKTDHLFGWVSLSFDLFIALSLSFLNMFLKEAVRYAQRVHSSSSCFLGCTSLYISAQIAHMPVPHLPTWRSQWLLYFGKMTPAEGLSLTNTPAWHAPENRKVAKC